MCWRNELVLLLVFISASHARISTGGASDGVVVNKCCPSGQILADNNFCKPANPTSHPWHPQLYSPTKQSFLDTIPLTWRVVENSKPKCSRNCAVTVLRSPPPPAPPSSFIVFDNGALFLLETSTLLDPGTFCLDYLVAVICTEDGCHDDVAEQRPSEVTIRRSRVKKCCGDNAVFSETRGHCLPLQETNDITSKTNVTLANFSSLSVGSKSVNFSSGFPVCTDGGQLALAGKLEDGVSLNEDGSLHLSDVVTLNSGEFCIEHVLERPADRASIFTCPENLPGKEVHRTESEWDIRFTLYPIGLFLSVFFLTATLAAGCLLPSSHHMLHWKCQTGHVGCLLIGDLLLAVTQLSGEKVSGGGCMTLAILMHFFFLAAFFWLNTMCFNIWWTFRDLRPASLDKGQEAFRLRLYQLYAWGGPLLIAGIAAILDNLPEDTYASLLRPRFGQQRCWFYGDVEIFPYFYGPVGVLLVINLVLFAATAHELTCGLWKREVVKSNTERATLGRVCLKLVVVMGLTWMADVVSWAVGGPNYVWYVTDLINALQGVFIFIVAGCQPQVWTAVKRLWCFRDRRSTRSNMGNHMSLYSQGPPSLGDSSVTTNNTTKTAQLETLC